MKRKIKFLICFVLLSILCLPFVGGCGQKADEEDIDGYKNEKNYELQISAFNLLENNIYSAEGILEIEKYLSEGKEEISLTTRKANVDEIVVQTNIKMNSIKGRPCSEIAYDSYNVKYNTNSKFKESFIEGNSTYGIGHVNKEWLADNQDEDMIPSNYIEVDYTSPKTRAFLISDNDSLNEVFKESPDVDFERQTVFIFIFSCDADVRIYWEMTQTDYALQINIKKYGKYNDYDGVPNVHQKIVAYVTDKIDVTSVEAIIS